MKVISLWLTREEWRHSLNFPYLQKNMSKGLVEHNLRCFWSNKKNYRKTSGGSLCKIVICIWTRSYFLNRIWVALPSAIEPSQTFPTFFKFFSWLKPIVFAGLCCFLIRLIGQSSGLEMSQNFHLHERINLLQCLFLGCVWFARVN